MSKNQAEKNAVLKFVRDRFNTRIGELNTAQSECRYSYDEVQASEAQMVKELTATPAYRAMVKANPLLKIEVKVDLRGKSKPGDRYGCSAESLVRPDATKRHADLVTQVKRLNTEWDNLNQNIILHGITPEIQKMVENFMKVLA